MKLPDSIPLICLSHKRFKTVRKEEWRTEYDQEVNVRIAPFACDICAPTGYMLLVSQVLCQEQDMINLHPAPPGGPPGSWQALIRAPIDTRSDTAGVIMHLVTPESDRGPWSVIAYSPLRVKLSPSIGRKVTDMHSFGSLAARNSLKNSLLPHRRCNH